MSHLFPTQKQMVRQVTDRLRKEHPETYRNQPALFRECVAMQTDEGSWLRYLGDQIRAGVAPYLPALDAMADPQLRALREVYAPPGALDWYIPRELRTAEKRRQRREAFTPNALFTWAYGFSKRAEALGQGTRYPTFRETREHFKVAMNEIQDAIEDYAATNLPGYLGTVVGMRIGGIGGGTGSIERKADYQVEAYL